MLRSYASLVYLFLYIPIGIVLLFSFNAGKHASTFECCSTQWFGIVLDNPFMLEALFNSLKIAFTSAIIATLFGTMAVIALQNVKGLLRTLYDGLTYVAIIIPGIVIGIATLSALVTVFGVLNPLLEILWPSLLGESPEMKMGFVTVVGAHSLFTMALVIIIVRSRLDSMDGRLLEASYDLYATPRQTFFRVTLPYLTPAIVSAFLLAFTFSFDDFIIAFFVAGSETTLPIYIFSSIRRGVTPEVNAISTIIIVTSLVMLLVARAIEVKTQSKAGKS